MEPLEAKFILGLIYIQIFQRSEHSSNCVRSSEQRDMLALG